MILPLALYVFKAAIRDKLIWSVLGIVAVVFSLSIFFGSSAITEQDQFARTFAAFGFRLFGIAALVLFVVSFIRRSFEARDVEYLLSRPIGRIQFVLAHSLAFSTLGLLMAIVLGGVATAMNIGAIQSGVWLWWFSIVVEFIIMANVAMFFSFVMSSAAACTIIIFSFYLLARLMGEILGILAKGTESGLMTVLAKAMEVISVVIPRLDMMGQTKWLLYGVQPEISFGFLIVQAIVFLCLVISATCIDMQRRQF